MKHLFYLLLLFFSISLRAQIEVPIRENKFLQAHYLQKGEPVESLPGHGNRAPACDVEKDAYTYVEAGDLRSFLISIDTTGLDTLPGVLTCLNCQDNPIGPAVIEDGLFKIEVNADVLGLYWNFEFSFCNENGCNEGNLPLIARRKTKNYTIPPISIGQEERQLFMADASLLEGPVVCNQLLDAADNYEGRDQRFYFSTYERVDSQFYYASSRYRGTDLIHLVLCDTFAICDTFTYAFQIDVDPLSFDNSQSAFFDDFSYAGPETAKYLWLDSDTYVNTSFGVNPPSVGVATFDGLDPRGRPYGEDYGIADRLTSTYIDLSDYNDELYLSFWYQRKGLGDRPETEDSLMVEFRSASGQWILTYFLNGDISGGQSEPESFQFISIQVPDNYHHDAFQFRVSNFSDRSGMIDIWNVDYIQLGRFANSSLLNDVAFTALPNTILSPYSSMPWKHFIGQEATQLRSAIEVGIWNHATETLNASPSSVSVQELNTGQFLFNEELFNGSERNIPAGLPIVKNYGLEGDPNFPPAPYSDLVAGMQNAVFEQEDVLLFEMKYTLENNTQLTGADYAGISLNDTVRNITVFSDYFAYDDGSAEAGIVVQENDQLAVRFTAVQQDTLQGIRLHFPHLISNYENQAMHLKVWIGELDNEPEFTMFDVRPYYADNAFDTLQGFTTYPLIDADGNPAIVMIPPGDFFVGWDQESSCFFDECIAVGLDRNSTEGKNATFFNNNNTIWTPLSAAFPASSVMIRPVMGSERPGATIIQEPDETASPVRIFPNPSQGWLKFDLETGGYEDYELRLINMVGQVVYSGMMRPELSIHHLENGIYMLGILDKRNKHYTFQRIILQSGN
ncbi:MAG TPA: hypothetical protein PKA00_20995 [Saprospiraceae bacterium]|nr:hypothetical protein [Saprospiraceae bacterium]HMQ85401.1 hypothetical protein [Saprospiraceae bacterium]